MPELISKFFRVAVEGDTVDGRALTKRDITDMGSTYDPKLYGARIWVEHFRSILPDSPFRAYGDVTETKSEVITEEGALKGKMALYARIKPLPELLELNKQGQKIYSSVEIHPKFAQTKGAYLMGLAVTDSPASVGTEILKFSAQKQQSEHLLFTSEEPLTLEFEEMEAEKPSLFTKVKEMFAKKNRSDDQQFADVHKAVEEIAGEVVDQAKKLDGFAAKTDVDDLQTKLDQQIKDFNALEAKLDKTEKPNNYKRDKATGADGDRPRARF